MSNTDTYYDIRFKMWLAESQIVVDNATVRELYQKYCNNARDEIYASHSGGRNIGCGDNSCHRIMGFEEFAKEEYIVIYDDYNWPKSKGCPWQSYTEYLSDRLFEAEHNEEGYNNELSLSDGANALLVEQLKGFLEFSLDDFALWKHKMTYSHNHAPEVSSKALSLVRKERQRQDALWGSNRILLPSTWLPILVEEVGEVATEVSAYHDHDCTKESWQDARERYMDEIAQVAAVAIAMLESELMAAGMDSPGQDGA